MLHKWKLWNSFLVTIKLEKMDKVKRIMLVMFFLSVYFTAGARNNLNIDAIFDEYGKREGSILIELGKDVLGNRTKIKRYKSLVIPSDTAMVRVANEAIAGDTSGGKKLFESRKDGKLESVSWHLKRDGKAAEHEYILFSIQSKKMTLIYVRGSFPPEELEKELGRLKDLFIKVNNKQLKI
jgi:hypothetical protein